MTAIPMTDFPLVTAILPTRGRQEFAAAALACWRAQTWPSKELIILDDADDPSFPDGFQFQPAWGGSPAGLYYSRLHSEKRKTIGYKRNLACQLALGEFIIHFDSDDYSAPERMADQVMRLLQSGKSVTGYHSIKFTDGTSWWQYQGYSGWAFDSSLCYRRAFWREIAQFADANDGLEESFRAAAIRRNDFVSVDGHELLLASIHSDNTSPHVMTPGNSSYRLLTNFRPVNAEAWHPVPA